jgi:hypothetical protein
LGLICPCAAVILSSYWVAAKFWWLLKTMCFYWAVYWGTYTLVTLQALRFSIRCYFQVGAMLYLSSCLSRMYKFHSLYFQWNWDWTILLKGYDV